MWFTWKYHPIFIYCAVLVSLKVAFKYTFGNKLYYDPKYKKEIQCGMGELGWGKVTAGTVKSN